MAKMNIKTTEDILLLLCNSVQNVLQIATQSPILYSHIVQRINKTCLRPDIGCFVMIEGGFSALVVMNFSSEAAMEIYKKYMVSMGMPEKELAKLYTSDDVSNSLGELMNQIVGNFQAEVKKEFQVTVKQNQPKMIVINKELMISIDAKLDNPQYRKVAFETQNHRPFYVELSMEKTEFAPFFPE